jgi:hypothetical protein
VTALAVACAAACALAVGHLGTPLSEIIQIDAFR